jgi:hypothetical protein
VLDDEERKSLWKTQIVCGRQNESLQDRKRPWKTGTVSGRESVSLENRKCLWKIESREDRLSLGKIEPISG